MAGSDSGDLAELRRVWDGHGRTDPLWAILVEPKKRGGQWELADFLATGRRDVSALMRLLAQVKLPLAHERALDFGCGVGRITEALAEYFTKVDGVDISESMISYARSNATTDRTVYTVNVRDDLSAFPDKTFDLVHSTIVLQHVGLTLARRYLAEFARVVKPDGVVHFQLPTTPRRNLGGWAVRITPQPIMNRIRQMRMEGMTEKAVMTLLAQIGLECIDVSADSSAGPRWDSRRYTARAVPAE